MRRRERRDEPWVPRTEVSRGESRVKCFAEQNLEIGGFYSTI